MLQMDIQTACSFSLILWQEILMKKKMVEKDNFLFLWEGYLRILIIVSINCNEICIPQLVQPLE